MVVFPQAYNTLSQILEVGIGIMFVIGPFLSIYSPLNFIIAIYAVLQEHSWFCSSQFDEVVDLLLGLKVPDDVDLLQSRLRSFHVLLVHALKVQAVQLLLYACFVYQLLCRVIEYS